MALRVPHQFLPQLQSLLEFPDERIQEFVNAIAKAGSLFNTNDLAKEVADRTGITRRICEGVIQILAGLYTSRENQAIPLESFVDGQVAPAIKGHLVARTETQQKPDATEIARIAQETEARWVKFRDILMTCLALDDTLGTAAKAGPVMTEHERILQDARVLTDIRPIFHPELSEKPHAAVLVHMLRLTTRDIYGEQTAQYFALDSNDIRFIKQLMDRAIKKEETLKKLMKESAVDVIAPKDFF
jgi:hypothetical protein